MHANSTPVDRVDLPPCYRRSLNRLPALRLLLPRSGLERSDFVLWPQAAVGARLLFRRSQRISRHRANRSRPALLTLPRTARDSVIASTDQTETKPARRRPTRDGSEFPQNGCANSPSNALAMGADVRSSPEGCRLGPRLRRGGIRECPHIENPLLPADVACRASL